MSDERDRVTFTAIIAPIQSAIKIGDDGARITLDVAESDLADMLSILTMRSKVLRVTIEPATKG